MYYAPGIEALHALRDSIGFIAKARLPIGKDGRNRPSLFPFGTATGRNAHARSPYNAHAGMRGFMVFPPGSIGFYLDWRSQEVGVAAALSGDQTLIDDYAGGDVLVQKPQHDLDETFWRKRILPEEDRRSRPIPPLWNGSYRWFRSPNIVDLWGDRAVAVRSAR